MIFPLSSGQTGATLTVNSSGTGTITVSNTTLGKSYSKSVTAGDSAVFKGLKTGTWTVTLTDGTQASTKTITITSDYSTSIAYFSATISITYPATSTCVVKNASGQTVASNTNTGTSAKTWTATVNAAGTYTVTATATDGSGKTKSITVSITATGQSVSVSLSYALILFDGADNTAITGGWESGSTFSSTIEVNNTIYTKISGTSSSYTYRALCKTVNMIPMDACNQLEIVIDDVTKKNTTNSWSFGVFKTITNSKPDYLASITFDAAGTYALDVSEISGDCYVGFSCGFIGSGSGRSMAMTASKVIGT